MNKMKKVFSLILMFIIIVPAALLLCACGKKDPASSDRVMTMSVNPEISFIVDKNNKIASVSFEGSEDAGRIYANVNFEKMDVNEAIKIFIEKAAVSGHLNLNSAANEFKIEVNGSVDVDIANLEAIAKTKAEEVFENLGLNVNVEIANLSLSELKTELVDKAGELYVEYTESELSQMTRAELIELINAKQKEYKNLTYSLVNELNAELEADLENPLSAMAILKKTVEDTRIYLDEAQENLDNAKNMGVNVDALQSLLDNAKVAYEDALITFAEAEKALIEAKEAFAAAEKTELLQEFKSEVLQNEDAIRDWINEEFQNSNLTTEQCNYWLMLINTNNGTL